MKSEKEVPTEILRNLVDKLLENKENRCCVDCGKEGVVFASVVHGTFICEVCAGLQESLNIGLVKELNSERWELDELKMLVSGGNPAFKEFFEYYSLAEMPIPHKYRTKAAYFYRDVLRILSEGGNYEGTYPTVEEGVEVFEEMDLDCESTCHSIDNKPSKWNRFKDLYLNYPKIGKKGKEVVNKSMEKIKEIANVEEILSNAKKSFEGFGVRKVTDEAHRVLHDIEKVFSFGGKYIKAFGACTNPKGNFNE